jgi:hypothetical protein
MSIKKGLVEGKIQSVAFRADVIWQMPYW